MPNKQRPTYTPTQAAVAEMYGAKGTAQGVWANVQDKKTIDAVVDADPTFADSFKTVVSVGKKSSENQRYEI